MHREVEFGSIFIFSQFPAVLSSIPLFDSIDTYNLKINISPPRYRDFDIRSFEENMKTVKLQMSPFRIPFYQIAILESGGGAVHSDGQQIALADYTLFFNVPGQIIYWDVTQDWKGFYISLDESFYTLRLDGINRLHDFAFFRQYCPGVQLTAGEAEMMLEMMTRMAYEYQHPTPYNQPIIKSLLSTVLSYSMQFHDRFAEATLEVSQKRGLAEKFRLEVGRRLSARVLGIAQDSLAVADLAGDLAVTAKHLSEIVKRDLGLTPTDFINQQLIQESQKMLRSTDLQVKEIAYLLGFQDTSYFGRLFKKIARMTPAQYRNRA